jgi:hypothetical protein
VFSGHGLEVWRGDVGPRQQIINVGVEMPRQAPARQPAKLSLDTSTRVDRIELAGLDQRVQRRRTVPADIRTSEGPVPAPDRDLPVILPMSGRK